MLQKTVQVTNKRTRKYGVKTKTKRIKLAKIMAKEKKTKRIVKLTERTTQQNRAYKRVRMTMIIRKEAKRHVHLTTFQTK